MPTRRSSPALRVLLALILGATLLVPLGEPARGLEPGRTPTIDKTTVWTGERSSKFGRSMARRPCDVNGDGLSDVVVSSYQWDQGPAESDGAVYILWGGKKMPGGAVDDPAAAGATRINGPRISNNMMGLYIECLGDTNGDGLDDLILSDWRSNKAYLVLGDRNFSELSLEALGDRGYVIKSKKYPGTGDGVFAAGDVNGDGLADIAIRSSAASTRGRSANGRVWILSGHDDISDVDLENPEPGQVLQTFDGRSSVDRAGSFAAIGDVNGDGKGDFALGSSRAMPWGGLAAGQGAVYVVLGGELKDMDIADPTSFAYQIRGPKRGGDLFGVRVQPAGDQNGDGLADLLVSAMGVEEDEIATLRPGSAAVVYGSKSTETVLVDPEVTGGPTVFTCGASRDCAANRPQKRGWWMNGVRSGDHFGDGIASMPDVTGDGRNELLVGAYAFHPPATAQNPDPGAAGAGYVIAGRDDVDVLDLSDPAAVRAVRVDGPTHQLWLGQEVAWVGDVDGDGRPEAAVSGDASDYDLRGAVVLLHFGEATVPTPTPTPEPVTPITKKWQSLGAEKGILGAAVGPELCTLKDKGCFRVFAGGSIYDSEHSDPQFVRGLIRERWASLGWENGALGYPVSDEICGLRDKGCVQRFQGGLMYWSPAATAQPVWGEIRKAYASMGWENSVLGYPTGPEFCGLRDNGCAQRFQGGIMYWSPATGAHPVFGAIGERYAAMGWETSALGYPTSYERFGLKDGGCFQTFSGGSIYFSPKSGAWASWGLIRDLWGRNGWENGRYGYPTGPESCSPNRGVAECRQAYQGGTITWNAQRGIS